MHLFDKMSRRAVLVGLVLLPIFGTRVVYVNRSAFPEPETITHKMNEFVYLEGAFISDKYQESTDGYSLMVTNVEIISPNEYLNRYSTDSLSHISGADIKSLVNIDIKIRNESSNGGLSVIQMYAIPDRRNEYLLPDRRLLLASETALRDSGTFDTGISIRPGTEYSIKLPYRYQGGSTVVDGETINESYFRAVSDKKFDLYLSNLPVRHVVQVAV